MTTIVTRGGKGSALTWTEGDTNFTNLNTAKLENVVEDTTPQLGGALDTNGYSITSAGNAAVTISPDGTGDINLTADTITVGDAHSQVTITSNGTGTLVLTTNAGSSSGSIGITTGANQNITLSPHGTGKTATTNLTYNEAVYTAGSTTGTITPDCANGPVQSITLTGSITLNAFANPVSGQTLTLIVTQPAAGGPYTLTSTMKFAGGSKTLSTTASAIDILTVSYIGTTYYASLAKGFA